MQLPASLSTQLDQNIDTLQTYLPIGISFDLIYRNLILGQTKAYFLGINGFCRTEILQQIFSDLQNPLYMNNPTIDNIVAYMNSKIGYAQITLSSSWDEILQNVLSGPSVLLIDGFDQAILIDVRTYPTRSITEPDTEKITKGARDGFVETMLFNTNLIRRRIRSNHLTFAIHNVGTDSKTDVAVAYLNHRVNRELLNAVERKLKDLSAETLTMGSKSLIELLVPKRWWNPLPSMQITERPDVACSYLAEGHILIIVDNSPSVIILPATIFQFTQSAEDYYKSPLAASYFRIVRLLCILISLFLLPVFLLITAYYPQTSAQWQLLSTPMTAERIFFYVVAIEFLLDLFKYSASLSSDRFSGTLSIIGGLIIGDIAVSLNWASPEILFYASITLLASLSISSIELAEAVRIYRIFLIVCTGFGGAIGFWVGLGLILLSVLTTPTFGGMSYFWPLVPFNAHALRTLMFRRPTTQAQPCDVWDRGSVHKQ